MGSIAAGGRYDNLVGMFSAKQVPAVGVSIGIERILAIVEAAVKADQGTIRRTNTQVLVGSIGDGLYLTRKKLSAELRAGGIATDNLNDLAPTYKKQTDYAKKHAIRYFIIIDAESLKTESVKLKDRQLEVEVLVPMKLVVQTLRKLVNINAAKEQEKEGEVDEAAIQAFAKLAV